MPSVNIYVSEDLKRRMDAVGNSWSQIARAAFDAEVQKREIGQMSSTDLNKVAERLRTSKAAGDKATRESGREPGRRWAMQDAGFYELKRATNLLEEVQQDQHGTAIDPFVLAEAIQDSDGVDCDDFWREYFGVEEPEPEQLVGFLQGAAEIWEQVADKV